MSELLEPRKELEKLSDYVPGKSIDEICERYGLKSAVKLASNENPWGTSPKAKEAYLSIADTLHLYPRGDAPKLLDALALKYNVDKKNLVIGNGSDEIIDLVGKAYIRPGDVCVGVTPTFSVYEFTTLAAGGIFKRFDVGTGRADLKALAKLVLDSDEPIRVLFLCNPNNPTGTFYEESEILEMLSILPKDVLVFLDLAYIEFTSHEFNLYPQIKNYPNLFLNHTFSKIYGLAGLRLGYAVSSENVIRALWKVKPPFDINLAVQAAAMAALEDTEFVENTKKKNLDGLCLLRSELKRLGFETLPSEANFICVKIGSSMPELLIFLESRGMIVRGLKNFGLPEWIRVTVGKPEENELFLNLVREWKNSK